MSKSRTKLEEDHPRANTLYSPSRSVPPPGLPPSFPLMGNNKMQEERIVFIPNNSPHDFSEARRFGRFVFLSQGRVDRYETGTIFRSVDEKMKEADSKDHLLVASLSIISAIASAILAYKFGRVNYLLFRDGSYVERVVKLN